MESHKYSIPLLLALLAILLSTASSSSHAGKSSFKKENPIKSVVDLDEPQVYIVHVQEPENNELMTDRERMSWHSSFLPSTNLTSSGKPRLLYSYTHAISGFAARLTRAEVSAMESKPGFLTAHLSRRLHPDTTHSPQFLGLQRSAGLWPLTDFGARIIIGVVDYGISPRHVSFRDTGMQNVPPQWQGTCGFSDASLCNKKIIGGAGFIDGNRVSPQEENDAHGTSVASIAAGNYVDNANALGTATGTASGMAPRAHLAAYKVCNTDGCGEADMLQGINQAIRDGVHILSISIGSMPDPFYQDSIQIGALSAVKRGILVSCSAGNRGPDPATVGNVAPWTITVGAGTVDRTLRSTVRLGNGVELHGESAYQPGNFPPTQLPLTYPGRIDEDARYCEEDSLDGYDVRGKIVMCLVGESEAVEKGEVVRQAGGAAMILMNSEDERYTTDAETHVLPASHLSFADSGTLQRYVLDSQSPTAAISFQGTLYGIPPSPMVGSFSARGPARENGGILKPDVIAPGVNIVLAVPYTVGPGNRVPSTTSFDVQSGTSFAAPHVSGVAALLKVSHPTWSAAAIKSAIMTSSDIVNSAGTPIADETKNPANLFAIGAGHLNPARANDPGLVYDMQSFDDYTSYLCGLGYTDNQVSVVVSQTVRCSSFSSISAEQLNYPSIALGVTVGSTKTVRRTVSNVGTERIYNVQVDQPEGVRVTVSPTTISFSAANTPITFTVQFTANSGTRGRSVFGQLRWVTSTGKYTVRSPIAVTFT